MNAAEVRSCIRQQLVGDLMLGVRSAPLLLDPRKRAVASPGVAAAPTAAAPADKVERLRVLDERHVKGCTRCGLAKTRTQTVFGQGNPDARLVFVGEAPGFEEDRQGLAFVGRAGELLTRMIIAMGTSRDEVFICNVLKCRPPSNRDPAADEILACSPYLREQLEAISPEVIIALGAPAAKTLLATTTGIGRLRGRFHDYNISGESVPLMPTYHPAYLLRSPGEKGKAWADLQMVMELLGLVAPGKR